MKSWHARISPAAKCGKCCNCNNDDNHDDNYIDIAAENKFDFNGLGNLTILNLPQPLETSYN
jgi:hypothetical protein